MEQLIGIFSEAFWYVAPIIVALTTTLTELIKKLIKPINKGIWPQVVSWVLAAGLSCAAWGLKVITFGNPVWLGVVCLCVVTGLSSNGFYDIPAIQAFIESLFKTKKTPVDGVKEETPAE